MAKISMMKLTQHNSFGIISFDITFCFDIKVVLWPPF